MLNPVKTFSSMNFNVHEKKALVKGVLMRWRKASLAIDHDFPCELSEPFFDSYYYEFSKLLECVEKMVDDL